VFLVQFANRRRAKVCAEVPLRQPVGPPTSVACVSGESSRLRRQIDFLKSRLSAAGLVRSTAEESGDRTHSGHLLWSALFQEKFPQERQIVLSPQLEARIRAQESVGQLIFEAVG